MKSNTDRVWDALENLASGDGHFRMTTTYGDEIDLVLLPGDDPETVIVRDGSQTVEGELVADWPGARPPRPGPGRSRPARPPARPPVNRVFLSFVLALFATFAALVLALVWRDFDISPDPAVHCSASITERGQCQVSWLYVHQSVITGTGTCKNGEYDCIRLTSRDAAPDWVLAMENWSNVDPVAEWPWPYIEGEILREPMPNWQLSLELLACGNHKTTWPRTCYDTFLAGLITRILACLALSFVVFRMTFLTIDPKRIVK